MASPLYEILALHPEFLVAHRLSAPALLGMAAVISLLMPMGLALPGMILGRKRPRAAALYGGAVVFLLVVAIAMPAVKQLFANPAWAVATIAILLAAAATWLHLSRPRIRDFTAFLSVAALLFAIRFLVLSPASEILRPAATPNALRIGNPIPVVLIVFDELHTNALLDSDRRIDAIRYPSFAGLAADGDWFRNTATADIATTFALPAILTGRQPSPERPLPTRADHPTNLLSMLHHSHALNVAESVTDLMPENALNLFEDQTDQLATLVSDLSIIYLHHLLPERTSRRLPPITQSWKEFVERPAKDEDMPSRWGRGDKRPRMVERFISAMRGAPAATLHFLHVLLPHRNYNYSSSGLRYAPKDFLDGLVRDSGIRSRWLDSPPLTDLAEQRFLLQLGFTDRLLGQIVDRLQADGLYDDALVIVTADHGLSFRPGEHSRIAHAGNLSDIMSVPLIIKWPKRRTGRVRQEHARTIDIVPTILDVLEADPMAELDGRSLRPDRLPETDVKPILHKGVPLGRLVETGINDSTHRLEHRLHRLGARSPLDELVLRPERHAELLGRELSTLRIETDDDLEIEIDQLELLGQVDRSSGFVPLYLSGRLANTGRGDESVGLAFALDETIVAVGHTIADLGEHPALRVVLPESAVRDGGNELTVLVVDGHGEGGAARMRRAQLRAGDVYDESALTARLIEATDLMPDRSKGRHVRGAATLVAEASHMTTDWPGQPNWHFVLAVERELRVAPPSIEDERTRTQLIVPVERRRLRITSEVEASSGATEAIVLGVRIVANGQQVGDAFERTLSPGQKLTLDWSVDLREIDAEPSLELYCELGEGARTHWKTRAYLRDLLVTTW